MFDHVGLAVSDLGASARFYRTVLSELGVSPTHAHDRLVEWEDWVLGPTDHVHPVTSGLHVGFRARDHASVEAFWRAGLDAGFANAGAPGPRPAYSPDYYSAFLLDPSGNSAEAVYDRLDEPVRDGRIDHLWLRVRDVESSRRFYETVAPSAGLQLEHDASRRVRFRGSAFSFTLVQDQHPVTEHVHIAFAADSDARVQAFHAAATEAGYRDNGAPGERSVYHPGYYGAYIIDPDGHNIEVVNHNR